MGNNRTIIRLLSALLLSFAQFGPVSSVVASTFPPPAVARPAISTATPVLFADSISWYGFVRFWKGFVNRADRVVLVVGLVAATALFIITRGKWLK